MKENIKIPVGTTSIDVETLVKINAGAVVPPVVPPGPVPNKPPLSKAGLDVSINSNYTILNGSTSSDPDGTISSYLWTQVSGAPAGIHNKDSAISGFGDLKTGVYVFRLTVTDNKGAVSTDDVQVTVSTGSVTPPAEPPVIPPVPPVVVPPPAGGVVKYLTLPKGTSQTHSGKSGLIIENLQFGNKNGGLLGGNCLHFSGCSNITIRNCYFSSSLGCAIYILDGSSNIKIENCLFAYNRCAVIGSRSTGIYLKNCQQINGYGSGHGDGRDGGILKLIECRGAGFGVEGCRVEHFNGESNCEDIVSVFASEGTQGSPINISGNIFRGGGPSQSGGGIVAGDGTASFTGGWMNIKDNILFNPGQYGCAIAGGSNIVVSGNKIYSAQFPWSNNPLFIWSQYTPMCSNNKFSNNYVNWTDRTGKINGGWNAGNCTGTQWETPKSITLAEMKALVPDHLITMLTPAELLQVRAAK